MLRQLNQIIRGTEQFRTAETDKKLVSLPTGDGIALAFFTSPDAPVRCAMEIARALQSHPQLRLRMGVDSGPVDQVADVNDRSNVAGTGINMAQRVMDCGDAGHILLSKRVAGDLGQYSKWQPQLHDLGEVEVKHGVRIGVVNFFDGELGNPAVPAKFEQLRQRQETAAKSERSRFQKKRRFLIAGTLLASALLIGLAIFGYTTARKLKTTIAAPKQDTRNATPIPEKSIAVLPFENLSTDKDDAYFADGIQDDVLTSLGKIQDLTVIARASVMIYRGNAVAGKLREIGNTLRVAHVLQGSVRRLANQVVVSVELVDTRDDRQIWSERYERTLTNALSLQGEIAVAIASELRATLTPSETSTLATKPTENPKAYLLYLQAREIDLRFRATDPDYAMAEKLYQQAIDLDPKFALARARLSIRLSNPSEEIEGDANNIARRNASALAQAEEALRLRPGMGEGKLALAYCYMNGDHSDSDRALAELSQAEKLLPNSAEVWQIRATIYRRQYKIRERIAALRRSEILDPRDSNGLWMLTSSLRAVRDWPEAVRTRERMLAVLPVPRRGAKYGIAFDDFRLTGNVEPLRQLVAEPPTGREGETKEDCMAWQYNFTMLTRDFATAERLLHELPAKSLGDSGATKAMEEAFLAMGRGGDRASIERTLISSRQEIEKLRAPSPGDSELYINLGLLDAFLGHKEQAVREGRRAVEVAASDPLEKNDASAGLALIFVWSGETDKAIDSIEHLLTVPAELAPYTVYNMTLMELKWRWVWDPLRKDARFQKILASPEPETAY